MPFTFHPESASLRLTEVLDFNAKHNPDAPFYVFPNPGPSDDVGTIRYLEFARASHRAAHLLRPNREGPDGEVVAVIALSDCVLFQAVVVGLITANLVPFPISPRNSPAAVVQLLKKTGSHRLVSTCVTLAPLIAGIQKEWGEGDSTQLLKVEEIPSLAQIYPYLGNETLSHAFKLYPPPAVKPDLDAVAMYLHSSGSTGFPKAIPQTHRIIIQWATFAPVTDCRDYPDHFPQPVASMAMPPFHMAAIYTQVLHPAYAGIAVAMYSPIAAAPHELPVMPTPDNLIEVTRKTGSRTMFGFPSFLIQYAKSPDAVEFLKSLQHVGISGGSVPQRVGDALTAAGVNLVPLYAATEFGSISRQVRPPGHIASEWEYTEISDIHKLRWAPQGDGTYELHILRCDNHHTCVENLPDVRGYATSDLFIPHLEKPYLWKVVGRIDDVIVHSIAEKTVPAPMENIVMSSPIVMGAVMFGRNRDQAGILIEPVPALQIDVTNPEQVAELRNKYWSIIEDANAVAPAFSRIYKEMILFTAKDKPLPRAGKGTVLRKATLDIYAPEIDYIYEAVAESGSMVDLVDRPVVWDASSIKTWLLELAKDLSGSDISPEVDLFRQGYDSLNATFLRVRIAAGLRSATDPAVQKAFAAVEQNLIYTHPTISLLSSFLEDAIAGKAGNSATDQIADINAMVAKYSSGATKTKIADTVSAGNRVVLLTGSSGSLGSQILALLLTDKNVTKIYAFSRPSTEGLSSLERHRRTFQDRGLDTALLSSPKLSFVEGQTDLKNLGLAAELFAEVRDSVTVVIHNAWMLDFNKALSSYESHIQGTRNLLDMALASPRDPHFVFTSSVSAAFSWDRSRGPVPEKLVELSGGVKESIGYGQSKFVAEQIIFKSELHASIVRIGQVCGAPPKGAWATSDWFPILVKTGLSLGYLPTTVGVVSWIDFDVISQTVLDVAFSPAVGPESQVLNVVSPRPVGWNKVINGLQSALQNYGKGTVQVVSFPEWCTLLEKAAAQNQNDSQAAVKLPGIKLLQFFRRLADAAAQAQGESDLGMFDFATDKMQAASPALCDAQTISDGHFNAWIQYWNGVGFI